MYASTTKCTQVRWNVRKYDEIYVRMYFLLVFRTNFMSNQRTKKKRKRKKRSVRKSDVVYAWKKNTTKDRGSGRRRCLAFDFTQRSPHCARATHVLTVCSCQRNHLPRSLFFLFIYFFFVNVMHFEGRVIALFDLLRLRGFQLVHRQRQYKYRVWYSVKPLVVARVAGCFPADEQLTDCELRLLDHELANFVTWISRPRSPVGKLRLGLF